MENNLLKVRMFGGFSLEFNDKEVVLDRNAVSKTMQLLQLILLHSQDGGISVSYTHLSGVSAIASRYNNYGKII